MPEGVVPRGSDARRARRVVIQERRADDDIRRREREHVRDRLEEGRAALLIIEERRRDQPRAERDLRAHALCSSQRSCRGGESGREWETHGFRVGYVFVEEREVGRQLLDDGRPALRHGEVGRGLHGRLRLGSAEQRSHVDQRGALRATIYGSA